jgi:hypothetical protein
MSPDGIWVTFHIIRQPNTSINPSIATPDLPVTIDVSKTASDATNLNMQLGAMASGCSTSGSPAITNSGIISTTQAVTLALDGHSSVGVDVTGTWTGTLIFEGLIGSSWSAVDAFNLSTELTSSTTTTNGTFIYVQLGGISQIRVRGNTLASGSAVVLITANQGSFNYPLFARGQGATIGSYGVQLGGVDATTNTFQFQKVNTLGAAGVYLESSNKAAYTVSGLPITPPATPTDIVTLYGSATKTVRILRIVLNSTQNTIGINDWFIVKRSTANTGGTSAAVTAVPLDSNFAAPTATNLRYTANPTALGTVVGNVAIVNIVSPPTAPGTSGTSYIPYVFDFTNNPLVIRGVAQGIAINFNGAALPAGLSVNYQITWTEE